MKVLVTGATGFVGRVLRERLIEDRHSVVSVGRNTVSPDVFAVGDISADTDWTKFLSGCEVVVHLAARVHMMGENSVDPLTEFRRVNVEGTARLARQAATAGVKRFVFLSSIKVNGESTRSGYPFTPKDEPAPEDPYGISKYEAEKVLRQIASETGMELVIIRPPLVYGPDVKGNFASLVRWVRKGWPLPLGAVHNRRSLVALDNLVDFIALCADRAHSPRAVNEVFLISDGEDISTTELLCRVAKAYGVKARLLPVPVDWLRMGARWMHKADVADRLLGSLVVDSSKAHDLLGWRPMVAMDEQLRKMAQHDTYV